MFSYLNRISRIPKLVNQKAVGILFNYIKTIQKEIGRNRLKSLNSMVP